MSLFFNYCSDKFRPQLLNIFTEFTSCLSHVLTHKLRTSKKFRASVLTISQVRVSRLDLATSYQKVGYVFRPSPHKIQLKHLKSEYDN